jgi:4-hydroxy-4-methyl-2-oxoglutarate aldolase
MIDDFIIARTRALSSASLHEAGGKIGALPSSLHALIDGQKICGRAFPVACPAGDNLHLHHAIYLARPGDVLVVDTAGGLEFGYWGEILAEAAINRGIVGLIITGGVRDRTRLIEMGFPVFAERRCIQGTAKDPSARGAVGKSLKIGNILIEPGDIIFGDDDGIVVLPQAQAANIVTAAEFRDSEELQILDKLRAGETTLEIYGLPDLVDEVGPLEGVRRSIEVDGLGHRGIPIPSASRIGQVLATGGVRGVDPASGITPETAEEQATNMFANLLRIVETGGGRASDILKVTVWISGPEVREAINRPWQKLFPDPESCPARHILVHALPGGMLAQCEAIAILER